MSRKYLFLGMGTLILSLIARSGEARVVRLAVERTRYPLYIPRADSDGLDVAGIRSVKLRAPIATITGWNVRAGGRRPTDLFGLRGAYVPFAKTKAERPAANDPRPSFEERYGDRAGFVRAVEAAARALVSERFLLSEDADRYVKTAREGAGQ